MSNIDMARIKSETNEDVYVLTEIYYEHLRSVYPDWISVSDLWQLGAERGVNYFEHQAAVENLTNILQVCMMTCDRKRHFAYADMGEEMEQMVREQIEMFENWVPGKDNEAS